jgi:hypothetical protein
VVARGHDPQARAGGAEAENGGVDREAGTATRFPWREYQELAFGILRWNPHAFWQSNVWELTRAFDGFAAYKGVKKKFDPTAYPDAKGRDALKQRIEREQQHRGDA